MPAVERWSASAGRACCSAAATKASTSASSTRHVDVQISLGDFVLSGGEIAAMALLDAVARLQPGVLNDEGSHQLDSFNPALDGLLDCPHYTRPEEWEGARRPPNCCPATMRRSSAGAATSGWRSRPRHRPDLIAAARARGPPDRGR